MDMNETKSSTKISSGTVETSKNDCTQILAHNENTIEQKKIEKSEQTINANDNIQLIIRCPFITTDLNLYIDPDSTVLMLKKKIYKEFPTNPKPSDQKLIYGGRILHNIEIIADVLKRCDNTVPQTIHLVINSIAIKNVNKTSDVSSPSTKTNSPTSPSSVSSITTSVNANDSNINNNNNLNNNVINKKEILSNNSTEEPIKNTTIATSSNVSNNEEASTSTTNDSSIIVQTPQPSYDFTQYVLINNVIYAVQPAPKFNLPVMPSIPLTSTFENTNERNVEPEVPNVENNNEQQQDENLQAQQAAFNQLFEDAPQEEHPNQFFLFVRLAFVVYLFSQNGGYLRMILINLIALIIFLYQTGRLRIAVINYGNINNQQQPQINNNNVPEVNNNNNNDINNNNGDNNNETNPTEPNENEPLLNENNEAVPEVVQEISLFNKCKRIFFAFFLSLIPSLQEVA